MPTLDPLTLILQMITEVKDTANDTRDKVTVLWEERDQREKKSILRVTVLAAVVGSSVLLIGEFIKSLISHSATPAGAAVLNHVQYLH